jgi:putative SOS response-associated peptidase YedK
MCGRSRFLPVPEVVECFGPARVGDVAGVAEEAVPGTVVPGLLVHRHERVVSAFTWGFFDDGTGHNARLEGAGARPAWRDAFSRARLVLPVVAFMEGRAWFSGTDGSPLAVAGLYRLTPAGRRATMLTRPAGDVVAPYHDRMPVILPAGLIGPWLAGEPVDVDPLLTESAALVPAPGRTNIQWSRTPPQMVVGDPRPLRLFDDGQD